MKTRVSLIALLILASYRLAPVTVRATDFEARYSEEWPGTAANLPTAPKECWLTGNDCYPEPRNFIEGQWHQTTTDEMTFDYSKHWHMGAAFPYMTSGVIRIDLRLLPFHRAGEVFENVRDVKLENCGGYCPRLLPAPYKSTVPGLFKVPITDNHPAPFYVPIYIDSRNAPYDGPDTIKISSSVSFRDAEGLVRGANLSMVVEVYLRNGKPCRVTPCPAPKPNGGRISLNGWINATTHLDGLPAPSPFGYLNIVAYDVRRFDTAPMDRPIDLRLPSRAGHLATLLATKNPDLHTHPPNYGNVMYDQALSFTKVKWPQQDAAVLLQQPVQVPGDRLVFRHADYTPAVDSGITSAGATLIAVTLGKGPF